jgi:F-type H+-transporting ATPase subunit b
VTSHPGRRSNALACETWRKRALVILVLLVVAAVAPSPAWAAEEPTTKQSGVAHEAVQEGHTAEEHHDEGWTPLLGRLFNFAVLAGVLVYFLRAPLAAYLEGRGRQIRGELEAAASMKDTANRQMADITAKLEQLPAELDALRSRGTQEIAAEEARIRAEAEAERQRLLEQTRREIDLHLRLARRELVTHAADLAVAVARERIQQQITSDDQRRLVDRYLTAVRHDD